MAKRYRKPQEPSPTIPDGGRCLPTDSPVAVYYRQSSDAQIGNISTTIQTVDMVSDLCLRGWAEDDIIMIDMDGGVSGMTKIDERPGMRLLFEMITAGEIGAVACQDEDRLFRDITQIQVNIFIEACRVADVQVITPSMVYDFAHPLVGVFHARQFRFKSEMAAEYLNSVIRGKLNRAKNRLMMEGRWAGTRMPPGFMVDLRRKIPNGENNENWKRFVPFEPFATVVVEWFSLFIQHAGNVQATLRDVHEHGPFYPDPAICIPPDGFKVAYQISRHGNGFCPERTGFTRLLSNAMYIGHWIVKDVVVRWDNHEPIVPIELFMQAFNYLSRATLDGRTNHHYRPFKEHSRPSQEKERPVERPLCAGMVIGEADGTQRAVGTTWIKERSHYVYVLATPRPEEKRLWIKTADFVDEAVVSLLHNKLEATFDPELWDVTVSSLSTEFERERNRLLGQLRALKTVMENQITSLDTLSNSEMIEAVQGRYEEARVEFERLSGEIAALDQETQYRERLDELRRTVGPALANWDNLSRDEKRMILHAFIDEIRAERIDSGPLRVSVHWRDDSLDQVVLPKQTHNGWREWLESETEELRSLAGSGASQEEISKTFPDRTWKMIKQKIDSLVGNGHFRVSPQPIFHFETYAMYQDRVAKSEKPYIAHSGDRWTPDDEKRLKGLVRNGASQLEIAEEFSHRKWGRIRAKITALCGKNTYVPGVGEMYRNETFRTYIRRSTGEGMAQSVDDGSVSSSARSSMAAHMPSCSA